MAESVADRDTATEFVCGDRQTITVVAAQWTASLVWNEVQCAPSLIPCKGADVLEQVRQACIASGSVCKILPTKEDFGVPCGSALPMRLIITFICVDSFDSFPLETILGVSWASTVALVSLISGKGRFINNVATACEGRTATEPNVL